jgi:hypothetical protein
VTVTSPSAVQRIERLAILLCLAATLVSLISWDLRWVLGVALGGAVAIGNFYALRRIVFALLAKDGSRQRQAVMGLLLCLKFGVLAASIYLVVSYVPVSAIAFLCGISTVVLSIFAVGFATVLRGAEPELGTEGPELDG